MEQKQVDMTEIVHFVTVSEMHKASKASRKHFNEVFSFAYGLISRVFLFCRKKRSSSSSMLSVKMGTRLS